MHEVVVVHVSHCAGQIIKYGPGFFFRNIFALNDEVKKLSTRAQLSSNVDIIVILEVFIHLHYVRMVLSSKAKYQLSQDVELVDDQLQ